MKSSMNLLYSREKTFNKRKLQIKIKKILPVLIPIIGIFMLIIIVMFMNFQVLHSIKKLDEELNENKKLEIIFESLDNKKNLVNSRKEIISFLETKSIRTYEVMEELQMTYDNIKLVKVEYVDEKIKIVGHCASHDGIKEFYENLEKINGLSRTKISHITQLMSEGTLKEGEKGPDLIWEFALESELGE